METMKQVLIASLIVEALTFWCKYGIKISGNAVKQTADVVLIF